MVNSYENGKRPICTVPTTMAYMPELLVNRYTKLELYFIEFELRNHQRIVKTLCVLQVWIAYHCTSTRRGPPSFWHAANQYLIAGYIDWKKKQ
jgi:hypothetical protein